jgi:hypothetical protein
MLGHAVELVEVELELEPVPVAVVLVVVVPADEEPVAACVIAAAPPAIVPARANVTMMLRRRVGISVTSFQFEMSQAANTAAL